MLHLEIPSFDLHSYEGMERMIECLGKLQDASNNAFSRIAARMSSINSRIQVINDQRQGLEAKIDQIEKSEVQYNLKFSSMARYPSKKADKIGKPKSYEMNGISLLSRQSGFHSNNLPASDETKGIMPEIKYGEAPDLVNANHSKINQFHSVYEGEYNIMNVFPIIPLTNLRNESKASEESQST